MDIKGKIILQTIKLIGGKKIMKFLDGKKTYVVAVLTIGLGIAQAFGIQIPEWAWTVLTGLGLIAGRDAVRKITEATSVIKNETENLIKKDEK